MTDLVRCYEEAATNVIYVCYFAHSIYTCYFHLFTLCRKSTNVWASAIADLELLTLSTHSPLLVVSIGTGAACDESEARIFIALFGESVSLPREPFLLPV